MLTRYLSLLADRYARERFDIPRSWNGNLFLTRWTLLGSRYSSRFMGGRAVFLHRFVRSDADDLHNHPFAFTSLILSGGYWEVTPAKGWRDGKGPLQKRWYGPGRILCRPASWIHRIEIPEGQEAWTLVMRGPKVQSWGFWTEECGFVPWRVHEERVRRTGSGCG